MNARQDSSALYHFNKGEEYIQEGDTTKAIQMFKKAIQYDKKYSKAYHRLAEIHLSINTLDSRFKAKWALEKALRLDPKNITYLNTQVRYFLRIGLWTVAQRVLKKIIKIDPDYAEAYFTLGYMREKDWYHFQDMVSPQYTPDGEYQGTFSLTKAAEKDKIKAHEFYQKAIQVDPEYEKAFNRIALLYYETKSYHQMVTLLKDGLELSPDCKDYHLFLGLVYYRIKQFEKAKDEYNIAFSLMEPDEKELFDTISLVSTPDEAKDYQNASVEKKKDIEERFWSLRDPLLLTAVNERILEHYSRIAYANLRFSRIEEGIEGWETDGGKVIIRFGHPESHSKTRPNMLSYSSAVWNYPRFRIAFKDQSLTDDFKLFNKDQFIKMIKIRSDSYDYIPKGKKLDVFGDVARFKDKDGHDVIEVYQSLFKSQLSSTEDPELKNLKRGIYIFDSNWNEVCHDITTKPHLTEFSDSFCIGWYRTHLSPGKYHLISEFLDERTESAGRWTGDIFIEDYDASLLDMSDIVFAWDIEEFLEEGSLTRGGVHILPNTFNAYLVSSTIHVYFEIYNLSYSVQENTHYRITYSIEVEGEERKGLDKLITSLFGKGKSQKVTTSSEYMGNARNEKIYQTLILEKPLPKSYRLVVKVEDLNTGEKMMKNEMFVLKEPPSY